MVLLMSECPFAPMTCWVQEGIETFWLRRGRGDEDVRPVEDGGLHAPLLLVDAARGEAPPVVGDDGVGDDGVGDSGEERLSRNDTSARGYIFNTIVMVFSHISLIHYFI